MYDILKERIKTHEGFRDFCYLESLGKKTVGWGHLCRDDEEWDIKKTYEIDFLEEVFEKDFKNALGGAESLIGNVKIHPQAKEIIIEMVFQLGKTGVSKFKKMLKALKKKDYKEAANQMLDSKWHTQTPERAEGLASLMRTLHG